MLWKTVLGTLMLSGLVSRFAKSAPVCHLTQKNMAVVQHCSACAFYKEKEVTAEKEFVTKRVQCFCSKPWHNKDTLSVQCEKGSSRKFGDAITHHLPGM